MSLDIFDCHDDVCRCSGALYPGILPSTGQPLTTTNYLVQNVNSAETEKRFPEQNKPSFSGLVGFLSL